MIHRCARAKATCSLTQMLPPTALLPPFQPFLRPASLSTTKDRQIRPILAPESIMANQQASLGSLPEEIILKIVKLVPKDGLTRLGTKDALFTLSLVNKKLRRIAIEQIFHTIRRTSPEAFIRLLHTQDCRILRRAGLQVYNCNCPLFIPFPYTGDVPEALNLTK